LTGGIYEVRDTLRKALSAAEHYIYIEDQFLGEGRVGPIDPTETEPGSIFDLFVVLLAAAKKDGMRMIFVGSGQSDPDDVSAGSKNLTIEEAGDLKTALVDPLAAAAIDPKSRLAVWRLKPAAVHAKMMIIDDQFLAIGSANLHRRSMSGEDAELHVAIVDDATLVRDFRIGLWSEHFNIRSSVPALADWQAALGLWRSSWLPSSAPGYWQSPNVPPGFAMEPHLLDFVGPK
jgi:phosphatidylserine/phosphatidylglycerophosphate/cardiolipin synthase-like enzyme